MAHPFHTRIAAATVLPAAPSADRRTFLSWVTACAGGALALIGASPAQAQRSRTRFNRGQYGVTTRSLNEEGASRPRYSTQAGGEEGGRYTTYATGEEGGVTTYALGEEGGRFYRPNPPPRTVPPPRPGDGFRTTFALGEEG